MGGCEGGGGTPTQGETPLEDGEQISFKVDRIIAASSLHSVHLNHRIKQSGFDELIHVNTVI